MIKAFMFFKAPTNVKQTGVLCKSSESLYLKLMLIYPVFFLLYFFEDGVYWLAGYRLEEWFATWNSFIRGFELESYEGFRYRVFYSWLYVIGFFHGLISVVYYWKSNYVDLFLIKPKAYLFVFIFSVFLFWVYPLHGDTHITRSYTYSGYFSLVLNGFLVSSLLVGIMVFPIFGVAFVIDSVLGKVFKK